MKHILIVLFVCLYSFVFSQKSSLDYFNEASTLYIQNKKNDAFFHVKRALEIYENDARLSELYNLIKPEDEPPHQCQNPNNDEQNEEGNQNQNNDGNIGFMLYNFGSSDYVIKKGDKIGQGIFMKYLSVDDEKEVTEKRVGGFGSTTKN